MEQQEITPAQRLIALATGLVRAPKGRFRIAVALVYGGLCHSVFALAVLSMVIGLFFGMSRGIGQVPTPWHLIVNALLLLQFPLAHSLLLSRRGARVLERLAPAGHGGTLSTTTYAILASLQLLALFVLWTPSGIIWWRADGGALAVICVLYIGAWLLLIKASYDAGAEVQSGALGWMSLAQNIKPVFPDMPTSGLFKWIRQPIYVSFALTLWTVPIWTPDQLVVAVTLTTYCLLAPRLKEKRFQARYGDRFEDYKKRVPYVVPSLRRHAEDG